ncbi:MAG: hypothetical protein D6763_11350 [Alphaproteobacteria bacterium]|nr:MAG: hypothetical protein D6763_11350 [Alphaproteobacteria bacterium]
MALALAGLSATPGSGQAEDNIRLGEPRHIFLEPMVVSVFRDMRVRGLLSVDVGLELSEPDDRGDIERILPRLRDRYLRVLSQLASNRIDVRRPVDIDAINRALQAVTDRALGQDKARVLVGGATVRQL